jgi:hypothetical protein
MHEQREAVLLRADDRIQSLAEDRMILHAQNANWLSLNHYHGLISPIVTVFNDSAFSVAKIEARRRTRYTRAGSNVTQEHGTFLPHHQLCG